MYHEIPYTIADFHGVSLTDTIGCSFNSTAGNLTPVRWVISTLIQHLQEMKLEYHPKLFCRRRLATTIKWFDHLCFMSEIVLD